MQVFEGRDRIAYVGETNTYKVARSDSGLEANEIEAQLANQFGEFVVPTVSYGRVNVQPTVPIVELEFRPLWKCIPVQIQARYAGSLAHSLEQPGNLGIHEGKVKFTDAGSLVLEEIMSKYPEDLAEGLQAIGEMQRAQNS
jgi:hypothetical protein